MDKITAVILAAGMGVRMGPRGRLTPKGLLSIGGATLVEQSVASLRGHGVDRIVIVTGHLSEQYETKFAGTDVDLVHNPHYATTGSLLSLSIAMDHVDGACLIAESDLIYAPQALGPLDGRANRFIVSGPTGAGDEVYVWSKPDADGVAMMQGLSKDSAARSEPWQGEMVGLSLLTADTLPAMRGVAAQVLARTPEEHYEPGLLALSRECPIECPLVPDLAWAEIDDEMMLERAEKKIYPRVAAARMAVA